MRLLFTRGDRGKLSKACITQGQTKAALNRLRILSAPYHFAPPPHIISLQTREIYIAPSAAREWAQSASVLAVSRFETNSQHE